MGNVQMKQYYKVTDICSYKKATSVLAPRETSQPRDQRANKLLGVFPSAADINMMGQSECASRYTTSPPLSDRQHTPSLTEWVGGCPRITRGENCLAERDMFRSRSAVMRLAHLNKIRKIFNTPKVSFNTQTSLLH